MTTASPQIKLFETAFNSALVHQVVIAYMAGARQGSKAQKTRADVRGGGCKPWKQKGTGRARAGSIRSPLWRGGGKIFAARPRNYDQKVNRKMYRGALRSIIAELKRQERLVIVNDMVISEPRTKLMIAKMREWKVDNCLIVSHEATENLFLSARNIPHVQVTDVTGVDPLSLLRYDHVVITKDAVKQLEERLA